MAAAEAGFEGSLGQIIDQVAQEKGIDRKIIVDALKDAMVSAAKKTFLWGDLQENQRQVKDGLLPLAVTIAGDYALLGETKKALEWLEKAFREREHDLMYLKVDDRFEALRPDPRFQDLVYRIGLRP